MLDVRLSELRVPLEDGGGTLDRRVRIATLAHDLRSWFLGMIGRHEMHRVFKTLVPTFTPLYPDCMATSRPDCMATTRGVLSLFC